MQLIADSGGTSTTYYGLSENQVCFRYKGSGLNPLLYEAAFLEQMLEEELKAALEQAGLLAQLHAFDFYGAGCGASEGQQTMHRVLRQCFPHARIALASDMQAAALALCGLDGSGIACVMGTGSNSLYWQQGRMVQRVPSLGYIAGDEGSGSALGKLLLQSYFYKQMPEAMALDFEQRTILDEALLLHKLYKSPGANAYLASFVPFVAERVEGSIFLQKLVFDNFQHFIRGPLSSYSPQALQQPIHALGGLVAQFEPYWRTALAQAGLQAGRVLAQPFPDLLRCYFS